MLLLLLCFVSQKFEGVFFGVSFDVMRAVVVRNFLLMLRGNLGKEAFFHSPKYITVRGMPAFSVLRQKKKKRRTTPPCERLGLS